MQAPRPSGRILFGRARRWCFRTLKPGTEPLKGPVEAFLDMWQLGSTNPERVEQQNGWIELLRDLLDATATGLDLYVVSARNPTLSPLPVLPP
jgi:hypothetical protein